MHTKNFYYWVLDLETLLVYNLKYNTTNYIVELLNNNLLKLKSFYKVINLLKLLKLFKLKITNYIYKNLYKKEISLNIVGLGYYISKFLYNTLEINLGYTHKVYIKLPDSIKFYIQEEGSKITLIGNSLHNLNMIAFKLKNLRKKDPYKNKGISLNKELFKSKLIKVTKYK